MIRRGVHKDVRSYKAGIRDWIKRWNEKPPAMQENQDR